MNFVNLHVHSTVGSWDSPSKIDKLVKYASETLGQRALAITEHGSMSSCIKFHLECKANGIKSIQGIEFYICPPGMSCEDKSPANRRLNHLVVLAKNEKGFQNLLRLTSLANAQERFYHRPRIDEDLLFQNSEGLIVINGHYDTSIFDCLFYNLDGVSKSKNLEEAKGYLHPDYKERFLNVANRYETIFGDDFYIECQLFDPTDITQQLSGHILFSLAQEFGFKSVGTGDVHYISPQDCEAHATFVGIKQQKKIKDLPNIGYFKSGKYCLISNEEAEKYYPKELIYATNEIVDKIESYEITRQQSIPKVHVDGISTIDEVKRICNEELIKRGLDNKEYRDRLEYELSIVELGELEHYSLIVSDYISWAEQQGIFVGRARGCLVNTNIIMKDGKIKDISEIKVGDKVISRSGNLNKVINTFKYEINEELLNIKTALGESKGITLTKDHKVLACKRIVKCLCGDKKYYDDKQDFTPEWICAKDLSPGDLILQPKVKIKQSIPTYDLSSFCVSYQNGSKIYCENNKVYSTKTGNKFSSFKILESPKYIEISKDFCYVLGVFIGDGWFNKSNKNISFCFNSETGIESQTRVIKFMESVGCHTKYCFGQNGKKVNQIHFSNLAIYFLFKKIFSKYNHTPVSKSIPRFVFNLPDDFKYEFLSGLQKSDGSTRKGRISYTSISKTLVCQIKYLLLTLNKPCGIKSETRMDIRPEFANRKTAYYASFPNIFNKNQKENSNKSFEDYNFVRIMKISKVNDVKEVYDFHVENEHNYMTTSGIVHNSSSGSLVCLLLNIIKTDPVKNGLSFERFYSPDRAESKILPDIDSDFQANRRDEVVEYIRNKYGPDKVCGVVTFNVLQAKSAIKDVLRIWDVCDFKQANDIADLFEARDKISDQLAEFKAETGYDSMIMFTLMTNPDLLKDYCYLEDGELKGEYAKFFNLAIQLEGSVKSISRHPSAYIICDRPIMEIAPLTKDSKTSHLLCALDMYSFESAGLVKFDILGILALDGLAEVNNLIKDIDINNFNLI